MPARELSIRPLLQPLLAAVGASSEAPLLVAVSGGGDSMALLLLAQAAFPGRVHAATVDHGLRAGAAAEAETVARWAAACGIPHLVLRWAGEKPASAIQERAREARYGLLARAACEIGSAVRPALVLAAHTIEDQAETFALRLAHGSGVAGLSAMRAVSEIAGAPPVPLLRPLLGVSRADLRAYLRARGQAFIEDPSNEDIRFERIRIRRAMGRRLPPAPQLARAAALFARLGAATEGTVQELLRTAVQIAPEGFARLDLGAIAGAHPVTSTRALARLVRAIGGAAYPPAGSSIETLAGKIRAPGFVGATLGGCRMRAHGHEVVLARELRGISRLSIQPGGFALWDRRFFVYLPAGWPRLEVAPLGADAVRLRADLAPGVPAEGAAALPGLYAGDRLVAPAVPCPLGGGLPASCFVGLSRVEMRLREAWAAWAPASFSPTVS